MAKWRLRHTRAFVAVTNHDHEYIHAVKSITAGRKGNIRPRGCVQVAFITSDGVIKVSTLLPPLSTPPSFCLDTQKNAGAWRCVGESKKRKERETLRLVLFMQVYGIFVKHRCTYMSLYVYICNFRYAQIYTFRFFLPCRKFNVN